MPWSRMTEAEADAREKALGDAVTKAAPCPLCGSGPVITGDPSQGHSCESCGKSWSCAHDDDDCPPEWWNEQLLQLIQNGQVWVP